MVILSVGYCFKLAAGKVLFQVLKGNCLTIFGYGKLKML